MQIVKIMLVFWQSSIVHSFLACLHSLTICSSIRLDPANNPDLFKTPFYRSFYE